MRSPTAPLPGDRPGTGRGHGQARPQTPHLGPALGVSLPRRPVHQTRPQRKCPGKGTKQRSGAGLATPHSATRLLTAPPAQRRSLRAGCESLYLGHGVLLEGPPGPASAPPAPVPLDTSPRGESGGSSQPWSHARDAQGAPALAGTRAKGLPSPSGQNCFHFITNPSPGRWSPPADQTSSLQNRGPLAAESTSQTGSG